MRKLVVALVVLVVLAVAADRVGAVIAQHELAGQLKDRMRLRHEPSVKIHGIPFLTQVIDGKYTDIEITADGLDADKVSGLSADVDLHGAQAAVGDLLSGKIDSLPVDRIDGTVTVPYGELARASGVAGLQVTRTGDAVRVTVPTTLLGRQVTLSAQTHPTIVTDGTSTSIRIEADHVTADGAGLPSEVVAGLQNRTNFTIPLAGLQFGLQLRSIAVRDDGLRVSARATHVTLRSDMTVQTTP